MEGDFIKINKALLPFSWLYGMGVGLRNFMFDVGLLKSKDFSVPVIAVGNITVGGTGKTPHVEYLVKLLKQTYKVSVLSRGYKRKTKGFVMADEKTTVRDIGDEPCQMKRKFPDVTVAVDPKRVRGIERLTANDPDLDVVLLDDAFQHRYVKPGMNILLVDYHRLIIYDRLLPAGRLREPLKGKNRADIVIVTKCPRELNPMEFRVLTKAMGLFPYQQLYFTTLEYDELQPIFPDAVPDSHAVSLSQLKDRHVLLLTGIASPQQIILDLKNYTPNIHPLSFSDHHDFTPKDVEHINSKLEALPRPRCIITTEKDAVRLMQTEGLSQEVRQSLYILPVRIAFMLGDETKFNDNIKGYVLKNSRNSILVKAKDDYKSQDSHRTGNGTRTISFRNN